MSPAANAVTTRNRMTPIRDERGSQFGSPFRISQATASRIRPLLANGRCKPAGTAWRRGWECCTSRLTPAVRHAHVCLGFAVSCLRIGRRAAIVAGILYTRTVETPPCPRRILSIHWSRPLSRRRPASPDAPPAAVAAGHRLFEQIGFGGMGEVYRCGDDALQRDLAIKVLKAELHGDSGAEERFLREARLTGSLQHPGIVPVHHLGQLPDGRPCYSMKLVRGRTLADLLRDETDGAERVPRLLIVVEKVCQAMAFAHSKGVIHRDLKPSNVMVGEFGEVQVMDWGLAKELRKDEAVQPDEAAIVETVARPEEDTGLSQAGAALGTPSYMPPEQAAGDWDIVDERADVFALGAMLCELLTGRRPYRGDNVHEVLRRARRGDVADALTQLGQCGADAALVALCRACLSAEPRQRPRHAGVVAERLASYQAEVRERLRLAELERARAEVKARGAAQAASFVGGAGPGGAAAVVGGRGGVVAVAAASRRGGRGGRRGAGRGGAAAPAGAVETR